MKYSVALSGRGTTNAIFIVRQLQKEQLTANKHVSFVDMEKKACLCSMGWNRQVVGAPGPVHVQGCKKQGKSRRWVQ